MTNKSGKNGPKPLTTRQRALIKELAKGQSAKDAAIVAGYAPTYARQQKHQAINRIKKNWRELLDNKEVRDFEAELIEALNPPQNVQRPVPPNEVVDEATRIFSRFRQTIHQIRGLDRNDHCRPFVLSGDV
jgi:hypothetical protein